jgi:hypothetical protein
MAGLGGDDAEDLLAARHVHKGTEKLFLLISEHAPKTATRLMIDKSQNLVEPVGAVALTAVLSAPARFTGRKGDDRVQRRQHQPGPASRTVAPRTGLTTRDGGARTAGVHQGPFGIQE